MKSQIVFFIVALIAVARGFVLNHRFVSKTTKLYADTFVGTLSEIPPGGRKIVDTPEGSIIVANQNGNLFAVNAKCPHLGLPMKTGEIESTPNGGATITCKFHNSKFDLADGKCVSWCTGVMGLPGTGFLAGAMGKMGGAENSPATTYKVKVVGNNVDDSGTRDPCDNVYLVFDDINERGLE